MSKGRVRPRLGILKPVVWGISFWETGKRKLKINKVNMKGLKPPYLMLGTHSSFMDYYVAEMAVFPHTAYSVCDMADFMDHKWLMKHLGCVYMRKFTKNPGMIRDMKYILDQGDIMTIYPESRFSPVGMNSTLPRTMAKVIKMMNVPVVLLNIHGSYLYEPLWNGRKNHNRIEAEMIQIISVEDLEWMTVDDIDLLIKDKFQYNDYKWQADNNIIIRNKNRCEGLDKVLYKCPHCMEEHKMKAKKDKIHCMSCGKQWMLMENGTLKAMMNQTEFSLIPQWYEFQRERVKDEILFGEYTFYSEVIVEELLDTGKFISHGKGELWHSEEGFTLAFHRNEEEVLLEIASETMYACHVEYNFCNKGPCIGLSGREETFYVYPKTEFFSVSKISLAVEEIYKLYEESKRYKKKRCKVQKKAVSVSVEDILDHEDEIHEIHKDSVIAVEFNQEREMTNELAEEIRKKAISVDWK